MRDFGNPRPARVWQHDTYIDCLSLRLQLFAFPDHICWGGPLMFIIIGSAGLLMYPDTFNDRCSYAHKTHAHLFIS